MALIKLSKSFIESYSLPSEGQILYRDTSTLGFGVKFTKTARTYFAERKVHGRTRRVTLGRHGGLTLSEARIEAQKTLGSLAKGIDVTIQRKKAALKETEENRNTKLGGTTLVETYSAFLDSSVRKPSTIKKYDRAIYSKLKGWLTIPMNRITPEMVSKKHKAIAKNSPSEANHTMRVLRAIFNHAMETLTLPNGEYLINRNPVTRLSKTKSWAKVNARTGYIKPHQLRDWWQAVELESPTLRDYLKFVLFTGIRREDASCLKWDDIDFKDASFLILAKNKEAPLPLPLSSYTLTLLRNRQEQSASIFVFPGNGVSGHLAEPRKAYMRILDRTGIKASIHDLRRSFAHYGAELAIPQYLLKRLMLHSLKGDVTHEHYVQHSIEQLRQPSQMLENFILKQANINLDK